MKFKFDIELNPHEKISYTVNTRNSSEKIDQHTTNNIHEKIDKLLEVLKED